LESLKGRDYMEYLGLDKRIILKWILRKKRLGGCGMYSSGSG
jgi:hypothetical protein